MGKFFNKEAGIFGKSMRGTEDAIAFVEDLKKGQSAVGKEVTEASKASIRYKQRLKNPLYADSRAEINYLDDLQEIRDNVERADKNQQLANTIKKGVGVAGAAYIGNEVLKAHAKAQRVNNATNVGNPVVSPQRQYRNRVKTAAINEGILQNLKGGVKKAYNLVSGKTTSALAQKIEKSSKTVKTMEEGLGRASKLKSKGNAAGIQEAMISKKNKAVKALASNKAKLDVAKDQQFKARAAIGTTSVLGTGGLYFAAKD